MSMKKCYKCSYILEENMWGIDTEIFVGEILLCLNHFHWRNYMWEMHIVSKDAINSKVLLPWLLSECNIFKKNDIAMISKECVSLNLCIEDPSEEAWTLLL